jgi:hypothetical protein
MKNNEKGRLVLSFLFVWVKVMKIDNARYHIPNKSKFLTHENSTTHEPRGSNYYWNPFL